MSVYNGRDYLYLIWQDPITRRQFTIGKLSKNGKYEFEYGMEYHQALETGFQNLPSFELENNIYQSEILFPVFSSRLPDKRRRDISQILNKYGLNNYDEFELLKRGGAKLPIDNLEFIDPIIDINTPIDKTFSLAGPRHYLGCNGEDCSLSLKIGLGSSLLLQKEEDNPHDSGAIQVTTMSGRLIGYIPRYYNESIGQLMDQNRISFCITVEQNRTHQCGECVKVRLKTME